MRAPRREVSGEQVPRRSLSSRAGSMLDSALSVFNPTAALKRSQARHAMDLLNRHREGQRERSTYFKGADKNRLVAGWNSTNADINVMIRADGREMRNRSRWLCRNNPHAVGALNSYCNFIISTGMVLQSRVAKHVIEDGEYVEKELEGWNDFNEAQFERWARWVDWSSTETSPEGFVDVQDQAMRRLFEDGEIILRRVYDKRHPVVPLYVEWLDPDWVDDGILVNPDNNNPIYLGVEIDPRNYRPVAMWFRTRDSLPTLGQPYKSIRIPSEQLIHVFKKWRPRQLRGIPMMAAVLDDFWQLDEYVEAELISAKIAACFSAFITAPPDANGADILPVDKAHAKDADGHPMATVEPGVIANIPQGYQINFAQPQKPGSTFVSFVEFLQRRVGAGTQFGLSYEAVSRDTSKTAWAGGRLAQQMDFQAFRAIQRLLGARVCTPIYHWYLDAAELSGAIYAPGYNDPIPGRDFWRTHAWMAPGWSWGINPLQDVSASRESQRALITTLADDCAALGKDWRSQLRVIARIRKEKKKMGLLSSGDATDDVTARQNVAGASVDTSMPKDDKDAIAP